jgi:hypothetical protein
VFRALRIAVLLLVLAAVAIGTWFAQARATSWVAPLRVALFPVNADGREATADYIASLAAADFTEISEFFAAEARRYGLRTPHPVEMVVAPEVQSRPPNAPHGESGLVVILWSLELRWWAWRHSDVGGPTPQVRMYVLYHDPELYQRVGHSLGLQKGLIGVVNAFATKTQAAQNNVIIAHELLHTLGAADKYDPSTNQPTYPDGYAQPNESPLLPQRSAEIMAGRIPLSRTEAEMPASLDDVVVGAATAREIRWIP